MKKFLLVSFFVLLVAAACNQPKPRDPGADDTKLEQSYADPQLQRQQIQVSQKVEGDFGDMLFNFYADENKTALDLLKSGHKVETKTFEGVGEFVESINGVKADKKHFWEFFVNGKSSNVGASTYKPVNKDKIEWKFSEIK